jgi:DNA repair exonuclease SbcCD ATPase subunit
MGWEEVADRLYGMPPEQFTAARDEAAKSAPRGQAAKIRALRRPTLAAWAVNLLVRSDRDRITALLGLGEQLRRAHQELDGGQLRELAQQQRRLVGALSERTQELTAEAGRPVGESVLREVADTVHAALADPDAAEELATGRMTKALARPTGFGPAVKATVHPLRPREAPSGRRAATRDRPASVTRLSERAEEQQRAERGRREQLARAREQAAELGRAARSGEREAATADQELADAEERRQRAEDRVRELEAGLRQARQELTDAKKAERAARGPAQRAREAAERDRERADKAADRVERLRSESESRSEKPARGGRKGRR